MLYLTPKEVDALFSNRLSLKYNSISLTPTQILSLMTPEEAKKLRKGDIVLVEMGVKADELDKDGDVLLAREWTKPINIVKKVRSKLVKGDIVKVKDSDRLAVVKNGEDLSGYIIASFYDNDRDADFFSPATDYTLICSASKRDDLNKEADALGGK